MYNCPSNSLVYLVQCNQSSEMHPPCLSLGEDLTDIGWMELARRVVRRVYLSWAKSLGAAHWVAQWARWKTVSRSVSMGHATSGMDEHTLLNAVLGGLAVVIDLACYTLDALVVMVLRTVALAGVCALCSSSCQLN